MGSSNMTLASKLYLGFSAVLLLTAGIGTFSLTRISVVNDLGLEISEGWLPKVKYASDSNTDLANARSYLLRHVMQNTPEQKAADERKIHETTEDMQKKLGQLKALLATEKGREAAAQFESSWKTYEAEQRKILDLSNRNATEDAFNHVRTSREQFDQATSHLDTLIKLNEDGAKQATELSHDVYTFSRNLIIGLIITSVLAGLGIATYVVRGVLKQLGRDPSEISKVVQDVTDGRLDTAFDQNQLIGVYGALARMVQSLAEKARVIGAVAKGDLTQEVRLASEHDVLGHALQQMVTDLNQVMHQLTEAANQVASSSSQVSVASQSLSQGATTQASSVEEISSAVNEMTAQAKENATRASESCQIAEQARAAAEVGTGQISATLNAMTEINSASREISKIIKIIDDIAFQTNLLALNAAVEAARAGRHGKGFAVVADEVRNLAGRSAKAAKETSELIESSMKKVENGVHEAERTSESFQGIAGGVSQITTSLQAIVASISEQAAATNQIAQGLGTVNQITQQNTASAEENAAAAEEMSSMAAQLKEIVSRFTLRGGTAQAGEARKLQRQAKVIAHPGSQWAHANPTEESSGIDDSEFGKFSKAG